MKPFRFLFACVVGAAFVLTPTDLPSCGPGFDQAIFTFTRYPRYPVKDYAAGRLGIIHPTYLTRFLWIAYRYLSNKPPTAAEQQPFTDGDARETPAEAGKGTWLQIRGRVLGDSALRYSYRGVPGSEWQSYVNCLDDAYRNAANTLELRARSFGLEHPGIKSWVNAQEAVFSNCSGGESVPPAPEEGLPFAGRAVIGTIRAFRRRFTLW